MREFFEIGWDIFSAVFWAVIAVVCTLSALIVLGGLILSGLGIDISPDSAFYKTQIERCRERGAAILDASGYLKECRLKSFD